MASENKETDHKTPWRLDDGAIYDASGYLIYDESSCGGGGFRTYEQELLAVRAVNSHDALVAALRDLRKDVTDAYKAGRIPAESFVRAGNVLAEAEAK